MNTISKKASPEKSQEDIQNAMTRYQQKYETHLHAWLHSQTGLASSMITGPDNFPVARMQKRQKWADNKYEYFREWRQRALKAISRIPQNRVSELESARQNLQSREKMQVMMTAANKIIRKGGLQMKDKLTELGLNEGLILKILTPDWTKRTGFEPCELTNNNAEVRRLRTRVAILETKDNLAKTQGERTEQINGVKLVQNYQADRIQLHFEGKPQPETISALKSYGFRWTPSQKAWQRKLTGQGIAAAHRVVKGISR